MEWVSGNIYIRPKTLVKKGDIIEGHKHNFDHTSIIFSGSVRITAKLPDGTTRTVEKKAPSHVLIRAEVEHRIEALEDGTIFWCVYAHRTPQGDVVQEWHGWSEAYY